MGKKQEIKEISDKIRKMQMMADELSGKADHIPTLARNVVRIRASLKMLELGISDIMDLEEPAEETATPRKIISQA